MIKIDTLSRFFDKHHQKSWNRNERRRRCVPDKLAIISEIMRSYLINFRTYLDKRLSEERAPELQSQFLLLFCGLLIRGERYLLITSSVDSRTVTFYRSYWHGCHF